MRVHFSIYRTAKTPPAREGIIFIDQKVHLLPSSAIDCIARELHAHAPATGRNEGPDPILPTIKNIYGPAFILHIKLKEVIPTTASRKSRSVSVGQSGHIDDPTT